MRISGPGNIEISVTLSEVRQEDPDTLLLYTGPVTILLRVEEALEIAKVLRKGNLIHKRRPPKKRGRP